MVGLGLVASTSFKEEDSQDNQFSNTVAMAINLIVATMVEEQPFTIATFRVAFAFVMEQVAFSAVVMATFKAIASESFIVIIALMSFIIIAQGAFIIATSVKLVA